MIKYGTLLKLEHYQRIVGDISEFFSGVISVNLRNFAPINRQGYLESGNVSAWN